MSKAANYFGLVAYMFVMYGGLPGHDALWSESSQPIGGRRKRSNLRLVASQDDVGRGKRVPKRQVSAQEAAA
jgi:hypothetical protein